MEQKSRMRRSGAVSNAAPCGRRLSVGPGTQVSSDRTMERSAAEYRLRKSASPERPRWRAPSVKPKGEIAARRRRPGRSFKIAERLDARELRREPRRRGAAADEKDRQRRRLAEPAGEVELMVRLGGARPRQHLLRLVAPVVGERGDIVARISDDGSRPDPSRQRACALAERAPAQRAVIEVAVG